MNRKKIGELVLCSECQYICIYAREFALMTNIDFHFKNALHYVNAEED